MKIQLKKNNICFNYNITNGIRMSSIISFNFSKKLERDIKKEIIYVK